MSTATTNVEQRLLEIFDALWDDFVDPREAYSDAGGEWWLPVGSTNGSATGSACGPLDEGQLRAIREQCRGLAAVNEFAINGHENRISYLVGAGHSYLASIRKGIEGPAEIAMQVQKLLDRFVFVNRWHERQQEIVRRMDRDGEAFLRFFVDAEGMTRMRFIEPDQVAEPRSGERGTSGEIRAPGLTRSSSLAPRSYGDSSFGIETDPHDVETVLGYWVDGQFVDAADVQHRRANVDINVKRGLPLYLPVRKNLRRAEKLLRNMSVVAEIQSAIALIRKHRGVGRSGVEQFVASGADATSSDPVSGRTNHFSKYGPGTILDAPAGMEYDFPVTGVDAASFVVVLQAELRAIAARLVMPEFMFTSDASNANYASTMVAEGPAVRMFERLQATLVEQDRAVFWRVVENAILAGHLPSEARDVVEIQIMPPSVRVRDRLRETQVDRIASAHGILSPQTWSQHLGLDYEQEQKNLAMHGGE
jgi:capsid protein